MTRFALLFVALIALPLAGCGFGSTAPSSGPSLSQSWQNGQPGTAPQLASTGPAPAASTSAALSATQVVDFIDPAASAKMGEKDKAEAASAQFYALQFGRPGAPRAWSGPTGVSGSVTVGPYVRVNALDCREFTHTVTASSQSFVRKGTACREADGRWSVAEIARS